MKTIGGPERGVVQSCCLLEVTSGHVRVRFTPKSGRDREFWQCPLRAKSGHLALFD
jgi:hypothetical protein